MEEMEKLKQKNDTPDKNFDMAAPKNNQKSTILNELVDTEK